MVDYVKFRNSSPLPRKSKRFDGTRYKEYLYGSVESLDTEWADKIVDYNPDLKLNTNGFTKYVDRNVSMSTECGFDLKSSLNSNDVCSSEDLNLAFSEYTQNEPQFHPIVKNGHQGAVLSTDIGHSTSSYDKPVLTIVDYHKYDELQKKYDELSSEYSKYKNDHESYLSDAEQYRSCKQKMSESRLELDSEDDPKQSLELLLDHIYAILTDCFGSDITLVSYLEKFANVYVEYQNKTEVELATLRGKAEIAESLDKLVADKVNYDKLIEQKDKTIESLVDELKASKLEHNSELARLKDELDFMNSDYQVKLDQYKRDLSRYMSESESLGELVTHWKNEYSKLLDDQYQILSQLPVAALKSSHVHDSSPVLNGYDPKNNFSATRPHHNSTQSLVESKFPSNWKGPGHDTAFNNSVSSNSDIAKQSLYPVFSNGSSSNPWVKSTDKPTMDLNTAPVYKRKSDVNTLDNKFLHSLVETLYNKNELAMDELRKKDELIKKQRDAISKLTQSVKEWESDAVLWLDYVDQSSSALKGVN